MFSLLKKLIILSSFNCRLGNIIKSISGNFKIFTQDKVNCYLLKNQKCKVRKIIVDNDYMTFPCKIGVNRCIGSCNDKDNPYFKVCLPDSVKNISIKSFDLLSKKNILKNISFHKSCKCSCLLDEKVCNNLQKWNKDKCSCECLKIKKCKIGYSRNVNNCRCEMKKLAALTESKRLPETEECDVESDKIKSVSENKTVTLIKKKQKIRNLLLLLVFYFFVLQ